MKRTAAWIGLSLLTVLNLVLVASWSTAADEKAKALRLGNFSVSLHVKDVDVSRAFYEKLGFRVLVGSKKSGMYILQNDASTIGVFEGHIEKNTLTYNPGWDRNTSVLKDFDDIREIQKRLQASGVTPTKTTDLNAAGPAHIALVDPDGNPILIDQHVPKP